MKNIKIVLIIGTALLVGLAAGYLLFGRNANTHSEEEHNNEAQKEGPSGEEVWICSMDPQIRQPTPGDCPLCGMDLTLLETSSSDDPLVLEMTSEAVKLANIQTSIIGGEEIENTKQVTMISGKIQADERLAFSQVAHVPGRIEKLFVTFTGEQVYKGQKIATIYSPELITAQRELLEAIKLSNINPGLLEAARNKLRYWKISQESILMIEENGKVQETFTIFADASGIVTNKRVAVGDHLKEGTPLFDMISLHKLWVVFDTYEEDLPYVKVGRKIEFSTPSVPNKTFSTRITFIDPLVNPQTRTISIRTEISNTNGLLKPDMFVKGLIENEQKMDDTERQLTVPKTAVLWTGKRSVVYVKIPDTTIPSFQFREIELGKGLGDIYLVLDGLEAGEEVVTYGSFTIDAAAQLNNQMSMMNKNVQLKKEKKPLPDFTATTIHEFKEQLALVSDAYLLLKDAVVLADEEKAILAAKQILVNLSTVDRTLLVGDAHLFWMGQLNGLQAHAEKISTESKVDIQREQFGFLSQVLIQTIKVYGIADKTLYVAHCPMAFDDQGADWLSSEHEIRNPYFGNEMLKCGVIKDTISLTIQD